MVPAAHDRRSPLHRPVFAARKARGAWGRRPPEAAVTPRPPEDARTAGVPLMLYQPK